MNQYVAAYRQHRDAAHAALARFRALCDYPVPAVAGMPTPVRLAWRIECGRTVEEAAYREWLYRLNLSIDGRHRVFGAPQLLGQ